MAVAREAGLAWLKQHRLDKVSYFGNGGFAIEIVASEFSPDVFESLSNGIEVLSVTSIDDQPGLQRVALLIPTEASGVIEGWIQQYLDETQDTKNGPANVDRLDPIEKIEFSDPIKALWTDPVELFPEPNVACWWEVWLRPSADADFKYAVRRANIRHKSYHSVFPERIVRWVYTTSEVLTTILANTRSIAELRSPYNAPSKILSAPNSEQADVMRELLARTTPPPDGSPAVCLLDTGINSGHPLLAVASSADEAWAFRDAWGTHDGAVEGHGTQMAGLSLYGNLMPLFANIAPIQLTHRIESYKVYPNDNEGDQELTDDDIESYGHIFRDGILRPETIYPKRSHIYCSAVTSSNPSSLGLPSTWSATIDEDCANLDRRRLFIISAGNLDEGTALYAFDYPAANVTAPILDPAQAWNALTVGAYTDLTTITDARYAGYEALAPAGALCPQSRTTAFWGQQWPVKPDIVLEGGNFARDPAGTTAHHIDDLAVITTNSDPQVAAFSSFGFTSGAAAQAAQMCASVAAMYPELWPETIRALMVHSAEYTDEMLKLYDIHDLQKRKQLLSWYGHGVPNKQRLLWSLQHNLTMIVQGTIQPFTSNNGSVVSNEIVYYDLPWPIDILQEHAASPVTLRVTLSYFVEPNPSRRGFSGRYRYASHGLRFAVRRPGEGVDAFKERINADERDGEYETPRGDDNRWFLKSKLRNRGCLISDSWQGTAAELVDRRTIAIYPIIGWWKTLGKQRRVERSTRFSLCVTLDVQNAQIDIYTPIDFAITNLADVTTS